MNLRFRAGFLLQGILVFIVFLMTGCMGRFERPRVPAVINDRNTEYGKYTLAQYKIDLDAYGQATDEPTRFGLRNKMVYGLMSEIDYAFYDYETKLFLNQGTFNVGSDALQLGLAAGGTITNGQRGKTILAALLSGVSGVNLSVDKNFFRQQTVQAISSAMEGERDRLKAIILQQLPKDTTVYPFQAARADLIRYFFAGTLPAGLQHLSQQAATNAQSQQSDLNQIQVGGITQPEVNQATALNQQVAQDFAANDLTKETAFLKAMGVPVDDPPSKDKLLISLRELGRKIGTNPTLRTQYFTEAKKAGLIH